MDIYLGILSFTLIVALLVAFVMFARSQLVSTGEVSIEINGDPEKSIKVPAGGKLLSCLLYTSPSPRDRVRSRMPSSA